MYICFCLLEKPWYNELTWQALKISIYGVAFFFACTVKNCETNSGPQSEVTCEGTPCLEKTWIIKSEASCSKVIVLFVRMQIPCFEARSIITRIESKPLDNGSLTMKSLVTTCQGPSGV